MHQRAKGGDSGSFGQMMAANGLSASFILRFYPAPQEIMRAHRIQSRGVAQRTPYSVTFESDGCRFRARRKLKTENSGLRSQRKGYLKLVARSGSWRDSLTRRGRCCRRERREVCPILTIR